MHITLTIVGPGLLCSVLFRLFSLVSGLGIGETLHPSPISLIATVISARTLALYKFGLRDVQLLLLFSCSSLHTLLGRAYKLLSYHADCVRVEGLVRSIGGKRHVVST
jgi:hypothetical protein